MRQGRGGYLYVGEALGEFVDPFSVVGGLEGGVVGVVLGFHGKVHAGKLKNIS